MNSSSQSDLLLDVKNLKKYFSVGSSGFFKAPKQLRAVDNVSLSLRKGEILGLVGESGCGKSTLGRTILRLYEPTSGSVQLLGQDISNLSGNELRAARKNVQMIFQDPYASLNPRHTIGQLLREPFVVQNELSREEQLEKVRELLNEVGINPDSTNRYPHEFSGGQRQRINIARALALRPQLLVADEPVSALDVSIQAQVLNLLHSLQAKLEVGMLFVSHDLGVVEYLCDRVAVMYLGRIVETGDQKTVFENPKHPYTQALVASIPKLGAGKRKRGRVLQGEVPSPLNPPSGCSFHPRCSFATDQCRREIPVLKSVSTAPENTHEVACWHSTAMFL